MAWLLKKLWKKSTDREIEISDIIAPETSNWEVNGLTLQLRKYSFYKLSSALEDNLKNFNKKTDKDVTELNIHHMAQVQEYDVFNKIKSVYEYNLLISQKVAEIHVFTLNGQLYIDSEKIKNLSEETSKKKEEFAKEFGSKIFSDYNQTKKLEFSTKESSLPTALYRNLEEKELISEDSSDESLKSCSSKLTNDDDGVADSSELKNDDDWVADSSELKNDDDGVADSSELKNDDGVADSSELKNDDDGVADSSELKNDADGVADSSELKNEKHDINRNDSTEELFEASENLPLSQIANSQSDVGVANASNLMDTEISDKILDTAAAENMINHNVTSSINFQNTPIGFLDLDLDLFTNCENAKDVEKIPVLIRNEDFIKPSDLEVSEDKKSRLRTDIFFIEYPTEYEKRTFEILKPIIKAHISQLFFESFEKKNLFYKKFFREIHVEVLERNLNSKEDIISYAQHKINDRMKELIPV